MIAVVSRSAATFPQYRHIMQVNNDGYSNYNSLQTAFKVRDTHGLTGQVNFTWSRAFDTGSANRGGDLLSNFQNPYRVSANYAPSGFDTPLNVNFTVVYEVPRLQGVPRLVGEGWQLNSIFRAQKGRPFSAYVHADPSHQGIKNTYADYDGSPLNYDYHNVHQFLNVDAFSSPADGTVGTARRNMLRQPGISQWDMSIFKNFKFQERYTVQFSWSVFNVLNHSMFAANTGDIGSRNCDLRTQTTAADSVPTSPRQMSALGSTRSWAPARNVTCSSALDFLFEPYLSVLREFTAW